MSPPQILKRAERGANGRILHNREGGIPRMVAPPVLMPKVVHRMTTSEQVQVQQLRFQQGEANRQMMALLASFGLDPRRGYRFTSEGEVIEIAKHQAVYD